MGPGTGNKKEDRKREKEGGDGKEIKLHSKQKLSGKKKGKNWREKRDRERVTDRTVERWTRKGERKEKKRGGGGIQKQAGRKDLE